MEASRFGTNDDRAPAEMINSSDVSRILRLILLAPDIADTILDGQHPAGMTLPMLMEPLSGGVGGTVGRSLSGQVRQPLANHVRRVAR